MQFVNREFSE